MVVGEQFRKAPASPCWYPGSRERYETFLIQHRGYELVAPTVPEGLTFSVPPFSKSTAPPPRVRQFIFGCCDVWMPL